MWLCKIRSSTSFKNGMNTWANQNRAQTSRSTWGVRYSRGDIPMTCNFFERRRWRIRFHSQPHQIRVYHQNRLKLERQTFNGVFIMNSRNKKSAYFDPKKIGEKSFLQRYFINLFKLMWINSSFLIECHKICFIIIDRLSEDNIKILKLSTNFTLAKKWEKVSSLVNFFTFKINKFFRALQIWENSST